MREEEEGTTTMESGSSCAKKVQPWVPAWWWQRDLRVRSWRGGGCEMHGEGDAVTNLTGAAAVTTFSGDGATGRLRSSVSSGGRT